MIEPWERRCRRLGEGGFALLITLLVILLLSVIIFDLDFQARADLRSASNFRDDLSAYYLALSGISVGKEILEQDKIDPLGNADHLGELWATPVPPFPLGEGEISGGIQDELAKINLNALLGDNDQPIKWREEQLKRLFQLLEVGPEPVDAIIDWIDKNNDTRGFGGAEDETYQQLESPYSAKNGPMDTLKELLFIKGIPTEVYEKVLPYVTIYPDSTDKAFFGKMNVNTADALILQSMDIDESAIERLMRERPYKQDTLANFKVVLPPNQDVGLFGALGFQSHIFSMTAAGTVRNTKKTVYTVWDRDKKKLLHFQLE
jgi:general secretion pathway protein K